MKNISIPNTDLTLSAIGLGTVNAGIAWDHADAYRIFDSFLGAGGSLIDTAHVYSDWIPGETARAERVVGEWIKSRGGKHDDFVLMTKGGHPRNDTMDVSRMSRDDMEGDLDGSLKQLGVDCVDIYFYHRDDQNQTVDELIEVMESFRRAGKIRTTPAPTGRPPACRPPINTAAPTATAASWPTGSLQHGRSPYAPLPRPHHGGLRRGNARISQAYRQSPHALHGRMQRLFPQAPEKGLDAVAGSCYNTRKTWKSPRG